MYGSPALWLALLILPGCSDKGGAPPQMPPPEVMVIKTAASPVIVNEEYPAQTEAVDTVEIRARVGGVLERQAYIDGSHVKKGDLLFVIDPQPYLAALAQAKGALAQATANGLNAKQVVERIRPLLDEQAISQQDLDAAVAADAAGAANVEAARAQVKTAQLNLDYATIRAPRDGVISKSLVKPGSLVNASTTLLTTLYSIDPIYVNFTVSEYQLSELRQQLQTNSGQTVYRLKLGDGSEYTQSGRLNFVDTAIDPASGTLQVRLSVPNPDQLLRPGQFVRVLLPGQENPNAIRVPQQAVQEMQGKRSVFVVDSESKAAYREVVANTRVGNDWLIESGLQPGETIIVEGTSKVKPGMPVKPVPMAAAPAPATAEAPPQAPAVAAPAVTPQPSAEPAKMTTPAATQATSEAAPAVTPAQATKDAAPAAKKSKAPAKHHVKKKAVKKTAPPAAEPTANSTMPPSETESMAPPDTESSVAPAAPAPAAESPAPPAQSGN
jgi:membrane fusion protein (multidrug efflux system)